MKYHKTAISRRSLSTPMRYLQDNSLIKGRALDYGCGRGQDADELGIDKYDPNSQWNEYPSGTYDTITCNFVLNVIEDPELRAGLMSSILHLLDKNGVAYISVRNDKKNLNGTTSRGTWQGFIELDLPIVKKTSNFVMYKLERF